MGGVARKGPERGKRHGETEGEEGVSERYRRGRNVERGKRGGGVERIRGKEERRRS